MQGEEILNEDNSENAVAVEMSKEEVNKWLDYKKVKQHKRDSYKDHIEKLEEAISTGDLSLSDSNMMFTQKLLFPLGTIETLTYKPRLTQEAVAIRMKGIKATDADARILAHVSALTNQSKETLAKLDTEDLEIAQSIAVFFI